MYLLFQEKRTIFDKPKQSSLEVRARINSWVQIPFHYPPSSSVEVGEPVGSPLTLSVWGCLSSVITNLALTSHTSIFFSKPASLLHFISPFLSPSFQPSCKPQTHLALIPPSYVWNSRDVQAMESPKQLHDLLFLPFVPSLELRFGLSFPLAWSSLSLRFKSWPHNCGTLEKSPLWACSSF